MLRLAAPKMQTACILVTGNDTRGQNSCLT